MNDRRQFDPRIASPSHDERKPPLSLFWIICLMSGFDSINEVIAQLQSISGSMEWKCVLVQTWQIRDDSVTPQGNDQDVVRARTN